MSNRLYAELNMRIINEDVTPEVDITLEKLANMNCYQMHIESTLNYY